MKEIKERVRQHREGSEELKTAKESLKEVRENVDEEIRDDLEDKKALEGGYRDELRGFKEMQHAIQSLIERRTNS